VDDPQVFSFGVARNQLISSQSQTTRQAKMTTNLTKAATALAAVDQSGAFKRVGENCLHSVFSTSQDCFCFS
jgi:hypothetical protein